MRIEVEEGVMHHLRVESLHFFEDDAHKFVAVVRVDWIESRFDLKNHVLEVCDGHKPVDIELVPIDKSLCQQPQISKLLLLVRFLPLSLILLVL